MMCGCTINKGGIWDSDKFEIKGLIKRNGKAWDEIEMKFISTNLFEGETAIKEAGQYEIILYVYDEKTGNTGVDKVNYVIYK